MKLPTNIRRRDKNTNSYTSVIENDDCYDLKHLKLNPDQIKMNTQYTIIRKCSAMKILQTFTSFDNHNNSILTASVRNAWSKHSVILIYEECSNILVGRLIKDNNYFHIVDESNYYLGMIHVGVNTNQSIRYTFHFNQNKDETYEGQPLRCVKVASNKEPEWRKNGLHLNFKQSGGIASIKNYVMQDGNDKIFFECLRKSNSRISVLCADDLPRIWSFAGVLASCLFD